MKKLCDLLFELSNIERMRIISLLKDERMKISNVAKRLNITVTEASRHLQRLSEAQIVQKDADGLYYLTSYGELTLTLLPALDFIVINRQYLIDHDMMLLPPEFVSRVGELIQSIFDGDTVSVFNHSEQMLREAEDFIWFQSYQFPSWNIPLIAEKVKGDVEFRFIYPKGIDPPPSYESAVSLMRNSKSMEKIPSRIVVTDKEAQLSLPLKNGNIDYAALKSKDEKFRKWCSDLFIHDWELAKN